LPPPADRTYLGIDVGTSGCRSCLIAADGSVLAAINTPLPPPRRQGNSVEQAAEVWWSALTANLDRLSRDHSLSRVIALALDGTSSTLLCCDASGTPLASALMYNDARATAEARQVARVAPNDSAAHGASASLAKLLWFKNHGMLHETRYVLHQADWLLGRLCGQFGCSDENNALKLGYDSINRRWPVWLQTLGVPLELLPEVVPAGQPVATLTRHCIDRWGLAKDTQVLAGTTDSTASFMATGAGPGEAVTSLGSTLVVKIMSTKAVFAPQYGIYSHRLGEHWLTGGASNSGGAVLQQYFSAAEIARYSARIDTTQTTGLDYYPLPAPGERFPVCDPELVPRLQPRPADAVQFFQGILEGIAAIEYQGYRRLAELGAPWPASIITTGGGANNAAWGTMRARLTGVPVTRATHQDAAYGAALLARRGST